MLRQRSAAQKAKGTAGVKFDVHKRGSQFWPLTRAGLLNAVKSLESVDYEGMLPTGAGKYQGDPSSAVVRQSIIGKPDDASPTGITTVEKFFTGPTAKDFTLSKACYL